MIASLGVAPPSPLVVHDRYQVVRTLGTGAQSTVFLVFDRSLQQWRALKIAAPGVDESWHPRFQREARLMARLSHPNVLRVYDVFDLCGWPAIVAELARGGSVSGWMRRHGPLPARRAVEIGRGCASALAHAHAHGVLHRDVKPGNVLLQADGSVALADFGIARFDGEATMTETGSVLGTLAYMAPEQRAGARVDARSDVYALGAMLFTIATSRRETELFLCVDRPSLLDGVPEPIAQLVRLCCRYDPADRLPSMEAVQAALAQALERCPPVPIGTPTLADELVPVPDRPPRNADADDFHVERLRARIVKPPPVSDDDDATSLYTPLEHETDETVDDRGFKQTPSLLPYVMPRVDRTELSIPDPWSEEDPTSLPSYVESVYPLRLPRDAVEVRLDATTPVPAERTPAVAPSAGGVRLRTSWPALIPVSIFALAVLLAGAATAGWVIKLRSDHVAGARRALVDVVIQERGLLQELSAAGADADRLSAAWEALESGDAPKHVAAAAVVEQVLVERERVELAIDEAPSGVRRLQAAHEAWKRAEACWILCD